MPRPPRGPAPAASPRAPSPSADAAAAADADGDAALLGLTDLFTLTCYEPRSYSFSRGAGDPGGALEQTCEALSAGSTDFDMTGTIVWLISRLTAHYLVREGWRDVSGQHALELGAGAGLLGLVASHWAARVTLTDNEPAVLALLARNAPRARCAADCAALEWGAAADHARLAAAGAAPVRVLLGADIVFWSAAIAPLVASVAALLERPAPANGGAGGVWILGYCNRVASMRALLLRLTDEAGLQAEDVGWDWLGDARAEYPLASWQSLTIWRFTWKGALRREEARGAAAGGEGRGGEVQAAAVGGAGAAVGGAGAAVGGGCGAVAGAGD